MCFSDTTCHWYLTEVWKNLHSSADNFRLYSHNLLRTFSSLSSCSSKVGEKTMRSSAKRSLGLWNSQSQMWQFFFLMTTICEEKGDWFTDDFCADEFLEMSTHRLDVLWMYGSRSVFKCCFFTELYVMFYDVSAPKFEIALCEHIWHLVQPLCYPFFPLIRYWSLQSWSYSLAFGQV